MRLATLIACAVAIELCWVALWPVSSTLSHSALFTSTVLTSHPTSQAILDWTLHFGVNLPTTPLTDPLGSPAYVGPASALALLLLAITLFYGLTLILLDGLRLATHRATLPVVVIATLSFQLTLFGLPGLFSQDVFSYIAYGRAAWLYGLNPYIWPPSVLADPVVPWVDTWRTYTSPYGPLQLSLQWLLAGAGQDLSIVDQAFMYRGVANVLLLVNLALAWRLLGRLTPLSPAQRTTAFAALAWNPLLLFEIASNAHNDVLMVTFSFMGLLLFRHSSRGVPSVIALSLGALVKYLPGIGLVWLGLASAARAPSWPRRIVRLVLLAAISLGLAAAVTAPWLEVPDSLDAILNETTRAGYVNSLSDTLLVMLVTQIGGPLDLARTFERIGALAVFGVYVAWEARQVWLEPTRGMVARALARSCLLFVVVVSASVQPWYFCLPLSIALALGVHRRIARLTLAYSAVALPALYLSYYLREETPGWVFGLYAVLPLLVLLPELLSARARSRRPVWAAVEQEQRATWHEAGAPGMEHRGVEKSGEPRTHVRLG